MREIINGRRVNPAAVRDGDRIATKTRTNPDDTVTVVKTRQVKRVHRYNLASKDSTCRPECVHLDHECYDTRFASVILG